jgi:polyferredoxin
VQLNRGWVATSVLVGQGDGIDGAVDQIFRGTDAVGGGGANKVKRTGVVQWLQVKTLLGGLFLVRLKIRYRKKISKKDIEKRYRKKISKKDFEKQSVWDRTRHDKTSTKKEHIGLYHFVSLCRST